jgi:hypothetical protein
MAYIDFNDETAPIGKRKQAYIRWAVSNGTDINAAKIQANKKFGFQKKAGLFAIVTDYGRIHQKSFRGTEDVFNNVDVRRYDKIDWKVVETDEDVKNIKKEMKQKGWDVIEIKLHG